MNSIEQHPEREAIETALEHGESYRGIEARFGVSKSAAERHKRILEDRALTEEINRPVEVLVQAAPMTRAMIDQHRAEARKVLEEADDRVRQAEALAKAARDRADAVTKLAELDAQEASRRDAAFAAAANLASELETHQRPILDALDRFETARLDVIKAAQEHGVGWIQCGQRFTVIFRELSEHERPGEMKPEGWTPIDVFTEATERGIDLEAARHPWPLMNPSYRRGWHAKQLPALDDMEPNSMRPYPSAARQALEAARIPPSGVTTVSMELFPPAPVEDGPPKWEPWAGFAERMQEHFDLNHWPRSRQKPHSFQSIDVCEIAAKEFATMTDETATNETREKAMIALEKMQSDYL